MICDTSPDCTEDHEGLACATHSGLVDFPISILPSRNRRLMYVHSPPLYVYLETMLFDSSFNRFLVSWTDSIDETECRVVY